MDLIHSGRKCFDGLLDSCLHFDGLLDSCLTVPPAEGNVGLPVLADRGAAGDGVQFGHHLEEFDIFT